MNVHQNARMTSRGRLVLVQRIREQGWQAAEAAGARGVSVRTADNWLARYRTGGEPALHDRRSTPGRSLRRMPAATVAAIDGLRRRRLSWPRIARRLRLSVSTVERRAIDVLQVTNGQSLAKPPRRDYADSLPPQ